jgi:methionine synthase II (cobalamin-independent)
MQREVAEIAASIPHEELAIQWDVCQEVLMIEGLAGFEPWFDDVWQGNLDRLARAAAWVPPDVEMGYHLCYGDYKHEGPMVDLPDATDLVRLSNGIADAIARPINWIQLPVPRACDAASYLNPLKDLRLHRETELYLGLVHFTDGRAGTQRRIDAAKRVVADFGVATECGFGRRRADTIRPLMELHRDVAAPHA